MRKALIGGMMLAALLLVRGGGNVAEAQGKKGAAPGVIEISEGKDGKFRFFVRDGEGKLLAMSSPGGFASAKEAQAGIDALKDVVAKAKVTMVKGKAGEKKDSDKKTDKKKSD